MGKVGTQFRESCGLRDFLADYPGMAVKPSSSPGTSLQGTFDFTACKVGFPDITDSFRLRIEVPHLFPRELPVITELGGRIPHHSSYHVFSNGALCLGSPMRLLALLSQHPTLNGFAKQCLIPYLYAISHKLKFGGDMPFGELHHGGRGVLEDYALLFRLKRTDQALRALKLLGMKRRLANKLSCPCDCGTRLGRCCFNRTLAKYRQLASRRWFRDRAIEARS